MRPFFMSRSYIRTPQRLLCQACPVTTSKIHSPNRTRIYFSGTRIGNRRCIPSVRVRRSLARSQVRLEKLRGRGPCLFILFALEAVIPSGDDQQLDVSISFLKRFSHFQALLDWDLCVTVAVNKQDRSVDLLCNMDWGVPVAGSAYQRDIEVTDSRVTRRILPTLNIGDREIR